MGKFIDLTKRRFGKLTVVRRVEDYISPKGYHQPQWLCKCDCENEITVLSGSLISGNTKSCGCYSKERARETAIVKFKKYNSWELFMTTNIAVGTDSKGRKFTIDIEDWLKCKDICWLVSDGYVKGSVL